MEHKKKKPEWVSDLIAVAAVPILFAGVSAAGYLGTHLGVTWGDVATVIVLFLFIGMLALM